MSRPFSDVNTSERNNCRFIDDICNTGELNVFVYFESCVLKLFIQANDQIDSYPLLFNENH